MSNSGQKSVVVVGAGAVGLCVGYYAVRKGHRVTIVERGGPEHDCCSIGSAGMVVPSHFIPLASPGMPARGLRMMMNPRSPFRIRPRLNKDLAAWLWQFYRSSTPAHVERSAPVLRDLSLASRECFEELSSVAGGEDFGLVTRGLMMLCRKQSTLREEIHTAEMAHRLGIEAAVLTPEDVTRQGFGLRTNIAGAVHYSQDCHLDPAALLRTLRRLLEAGGAQFLWNTEVTGWRCEGRRVAAIRTVNGEIEADEYVLAAGSWSPGVARGLKLRLPIQAGKGYSVTIPTPKRMPNLCAILAEARVAVTPMGSGLRFGGTMEVAGMDQTVSRTRVNAMFRAIPRYFPDFSPEEFRDLPVWSGLRPCSPDGLPYVGRVGRYDNLSLATGHAMMGISLAPITGKLIAEIVSGEPPSIPIGMLDSDRFG